MNAFVVVDASVWVSLLLPQDIHHLSSRLWVESYVRRGGLLVGPELLLVEVAAASARRTQQTLLPRQTVQYLTTLSVLRLVPVDAALVNAAIDAVINFRLRAGDATYVGLAQQLNIPLVSWDDEQLRRAGVLIDNYTPDNYPF